jgi:2-polyprenyl-3-methyl-5-hydroxy-6-metoxy-1,4-benzoquinol methylase
MIARDVAARPFIERALTDLGVSEIDSAMVSEWAARCDAAGTVFPVVFDLVRSRPVQASFVTHCYRRILGRGGDLEIADPGGWAGNLASMLDGADRLHKIAEFIASDEFFSNRSGSNNSVFISLLKNEFLLQPGDIDEARLENALAGEILRFTLVLDALNTPSVKRRIAITTFNQFGIERPDRQRLNAIEAQTEFFIETAIAWALLSDEYASSVGAAAYNVQHHARRFVDVHAGRFFGPRAAEVLRAAGGQNRFENVLTEAGSIPALFFGFATLPEALDYHREVVGAKLTAASRLEELVEDASVASDADRFADWQAQLLLVAGWIVDRWIDKFTIADFRDVDRAAVHGFWTHRLALNEYYVAVLCEFLAAPYCLGFDTRSFVAPIEELNLPPGSLALPLPDWADAPASAPDPQLAIASSFFYWYDVFGNMEFLRSPDGPPPPTPDHLALTLKPSDFDNCSYLLMSWHIKELRDMAEAGIDIALAVFFGTPFSDDHLLTNANDIARNTRNRFSDVGLRMLRRAWRRLDRQGVRVPKIAMHFDTTSLTGVNAKRLKVNYRPFIGVRWFYETIRNFYSHLPPEMWACRDGRPIIFVYHPSFGGNAHPGIYPFLRQRFRRDFGVDPFIVTAAEEEGARVLRSDRLEPWVTRLGHDNAFDVLADFLAEDELYAHCSGDDRRYADFLLRQMFGGEGGGDRQVPEPLDQRDARRRFVAQLIAGRPFAARVVADWFYRFLRRRPADCDAGDRALAAIVEERLCQARDWWGALALLLQSPQFSAAAGGTDEYLIDWVYQCVVMKCPNADCPDGSTTSCDTAGKDAFLATCRAAGRTAAIGEFLVRVEVRQALVSEWFSSYWAWYNPGPADSSFYWSAAISPCIRDTASIGPGYDQSAIFSRKQIYMPRNDGATYAARWEWLLAMDPRPWLVHLESWNEFFEGTSICDTAEYGRQYIEITRKYADMYHAAQPPQNAAPTVLREAPVKPTLEQVLNEISWWQKWEIVPGVFTSGPHDVKFLLDNLELPASMDGARVLDIGGWNGAFSFECERRNAAEVIMIEPTPVTATGFDRTKAFLESNVKCYPGTIYDLDPKWLGHFDIVLCLGVIYHLRYPLLGLDNIRRVCRDRLYVESAILEVASWTPTGIRHLADLGANLSELPFLQFFPGAEYFSDSTCWYIPNAMAADGMIEAAGFEVLHSHVNRRYFCRARVRPGRPPMFTAAHEGVDYETHARHLLGPPSKWPGMPQG